MGDYHEKKPTVTAIIQARMQSKRLPGKSMKEIAGKPLLAHVIDRAKAMEGVGAVVVATCDGNQPIVELAASMGVQSFVGSEANVLDRYYLSALQAGGDYIVRITGDNPFTDVEYGSMAIEIATESGGGQMHECSHRMHIDRFGIVRLYIMIDLLQPLLFLKH